MKRTIITGLILAMVLGIGVATVFAHEQGCTPGFWKNHPEAWVDYEPDDPFNAILGTWDFTVELPGDPTLMEALNLGGGCINALIRHGAAGLLNAADPEVDYGLTEFEVLLLVASPVEGVLPDDCEKNKDVLEWANEAGCPLRATGGVGIGKNNPRGYQLCVDGSAAKSSGGSFWDTFLDARLKDVHGDYEPGLSEICRLTPVWYSYKQDNDQDLPAEGESVGVVAQQVQAVLPEAVEENSDGYLMVNNDHIIWAMVNAIKELDAQNQELKAQNMELIQRLDVLERTMGQHKLAVAKNVQ